MESSSNIPHPGERIRSEIIPADMTVTKAAKLIGVGRPALSNLLNGNASLSVEMAKRLEKAFGCSSKALMAMQADYDEAQAGLKQVPSNTRTYVPPFLAIKANDIERWVSHHIAARTRLPVFLRMLVHSTGRGLTKVDFPGNDDGERAGWDGFTEAADGTPWVPQGCTGWEFGTNENIKTKADGDFKKSVKAIDKKTRAGTTFIFVTPRHWAGKADWVEARLREGEWKAVRAYDASDLEQWLEQSLPAQAWFANETKIPAQDVRSLDQCWTDWANVSEPPLSGMLFHPSVQAAKQTIISRLSAAPDGPTLIAADSTSEALAFLAALFNVLELGSYRDQILVFDKTGVLPRLADGAQTFIPVIHTREVEQELATLAKSMHAIVVYPRNAVPREPHIVLEPIDSESFANALSVMGKSRDDISRLAKESGKSLTVLRRQLATVPVVQIPLWARDSKTAESLIPFMLVGAWNSKNTVDRSALEQLAGHQSYDSLERAVQSLVQLDDAPLWSIGGYRGVISKIDLLYAIRGYVTAQDLRRYFETALQVLGEDDPALDLDEDKRWAASVFGKTRQFSHQFREGMAETLVLLAVHGKELFGTRLGVDIASEVKHIVGSLLPTPLTVRQLQANDHNLPTYAEAAPDIFLSALERDLKLDKPAVLELLRPVGTAPFSQPKRTGLLWALELLAWYPETLSRAVMILARLAQIEINDNLFNKPINSLISIFRVWMPQTSATHEMRVVLIKKLIDTFPVVAWSLCLSQLDFTNQMGFHSRKPKWRSIGGDAGEPLSDHAVDAFLNEMTELMVDWTSHSLSTLSDLVAYIHHFSESQQARIWTLIQHWANSDINDVDRAALREKIRQSVLLKRLKGKAAGDSQQQALMTAARASYDALESHELLNKHAWLFRQNWVDESADEMEQADLSDNVDKREKRIQRLRIAALREIYTQQGIAGVLELATQGDTAWLVGHLMTKNILSSVKALQAFLHQALTSVLAGQASSGACRRLIAGVMGAIDDPKRRESIVRRVAGDSQDALVQLLLLFSFEKETWTLVDTLNDSAQQAYWHEVMPGWIRHVEEEGEEAVIRLLNVGRPRTAFACIQYHPEKIDVEVLYRLLSEIATDRDNDKPGQYKLDHYRIEQALACVNNSHQQLTLDQKAALEFVYIELLARSLDRKRNPSILNIERYIEAHPEFFVQLIVWGFKRKNGGADPAAFQVSDEVQLQNLAERGYQLLNTIRYIPAHNEQGKLQKDCLESWVATVRQSCRELDRIDIADRCIGQILAFAPVGEDGIWPCEEVRDVLEDIQSEKMMSSMCSEVFSSRGWVIDRGKNSERELAEKYQQWGQSILVSHPFVATRLLLTLSQDYERYASREDTEVHVRRRLQVD